MKKNTKRFDLYKKPIKPRWYFRVVERVISPIYCWFSNSHAKVDKEVRKVKGPFFVLATHHAFLDFPQLAAAISPKITNWVMGVDEYRRGDWLMHGLGGIPKRKFSHDISTTKNMIYALRHLKQPVAIYPEARFSLAGVNERLDGALGKFCKFANVPVLMFKSFGNFINSPQWCKKPYRKIRKEAHLYVLYTVEQLKNMTAEQVQNGIEEAFVRDEYRWQVEKNYHVKCKKRANGLYRLLYKCPNCGKEHEMQSEGIYLWCSHCGAKWEMDTLSRLKGVNTDKGFSHIPDWYNWEREEVRKEVQNGTYHFEDDVRVEDFYSSKTGCIPVGEAHMTHDSDGYKVVGTVDGQPFEVHKSVSEMYSCHIEYNYLKRGDAVEIATDKTTYFMYPKTAKNCLTKLHFATEELYDFYVRNKR